MRLLTALFIILLQISPAGASIFETQTFTLDNGMQVAVIENHRAPVVTHMVQNRKY